MDERAPGAALRRPGQYARSRGLELAFRPRPTAGSKAQRASERWLRSWHNWRATDALHDISLGRGNIDHILVGPGSIFTIETKSHQEPTNVDRIDPKMLKQAYAQKKLLERITGLEVQPLLVFSRAYLVGHVPAQRRGVTILPARMLQHYFSRRRPILEASEADEVYARLTVAL